MAAPHHDTRHEVRRDSMHTTDKRGSVRDAASRAPRFQTAIQCADLCRNTARLRFGHDPTERELKTFLVKRSC
jgi:hypothetical protein